MANSALNANNLFDREDQAILPRQMWWEVLLIVSLFFLFAGGPTPDVNEAHYLAKAKHYWNPGWCGRDMFLDSADAHLVFCWIFGWMTLWWSLGTVAWLGRLVTWALMAIGWQRLSWSVCPQRHVSVATAALFLTLSDHGHLAGEWAVGGLEAKGLAYAFVLFGLRCVVQERWRAVWLWLGAASAVHVLVGGWSVLAAAICWGLSGSTRPPLHSMLGSLLLAACLSLGGLLPALMLSLHVEAATADQANQIHVFGRLAHHLVFHRFAGQRMASFAVLLILWSALWWEARKTLAWRRLNRFAVAALVIAATGVVLDLVLLGRPSLAAALLKFYWFRLSDVAVPLVVALAIPVVISRLSDRRLQLSRLAWALAVVVPGLLLGWKYVARQIDFRPAAEIQSRPIGSHGARQMYRRYVAWRRACEWIADNTPPNSRFLTPRNQQTFKWYAGRAEVVCWKDVPQDAASIVKWWHLTSEIYPPDVVEFGLGAWNDQQLREIARREQADYILVDRSRTSRRLGLHRVYPGGAALNSDFELYRVRE